MAEAERDRIQLTSRISQLEMDKRELEMQNAKTVAENQDLLDQLEMLNTAVTDSDTRIRSLEATLQSSHQAVLRLEKAASRAADMERHIALLEEEHFKLRNTLVTTESDARSAMQRWRKAEREIDELQQQLEKMEREARDEREKHVEMLGRIERQREVEKELNTAAGRLKGAAAVKTMAGKAGSSVVSHFVRDLLQDNANLQLGIAELREMLSTSNDEIQALREQLLFHQPAMHDSEVSAASTLRAELEGAKESVEDQEAGEPLLHSQAQPHPVVSQELHIHHHYYSTPKPEHRRSKKKRQSLHPSVFKPPAISTPSTPSSSAGPWRLGPSPVAPALLSRSARDSRSSSPIVPPSNRWSLVSEQPSEFAPSSVPSTPISTKRNSVFDRGVFETDMPASPTTSIDPMSPTWRISHRRMASDVSARSSYSQGQPSNPPVSLLSAPVPIPFTPGDTSSNTTPHASSYVYTHTTTLAHPIHEEDLADTTPDLTLTEESAEESSTSKDDDFNNSPRRLHRAVSHESIMSLSGGLDIHTLKTRPSQLTLRPIGGADVVLTGVMAQTTRFAGGDKRGSVVLRDNLLVGSPRVVSTPTSRSPEPNSGFGRWKSWRPWGGSPIESPTTPKADKDKDKERDVLRAPGINQPGAIPGLLASQRKRGAPAKVTTETVDRAALREVLED